DVLAHVERAVEVDDLALDIHRMSLAFRRGGRTLLQEAERARTLVEPLLREDLTERAVDHEVGVAPNGRGEVPICRAGETKVAEIRSFVRRLFHGAQKEHVEDIARGMLRDTL